MLQPKQNKIAKSDLSRLIQSTAFKNIILIEPYDLSDEKYLVALLKKYKSESVSIIIGVTK